MALYLEHFGLKEPPFRITPHTDFFFDGADRGATLEALIYAILVPPVVLLVFVALMVLESDYTLLTRMLFLGGR